MALSYATAATALRGGDRLMVTHPNPNMVTEQTIYALASTGRKVSQPAFRKLKPNLRPVADGLFPDISQTYQWQD